MRRQHLGGKGNVVVLVGTGGVDLLLLLLQCEDEVYRVPSYPTYAMKDLLCPLQQTVGKDQPATDLRLALSAAAGAAGAAAAAAAAGSAAAAAALPCCSVRLFNRNP